MTYPTLSKWNGYANIRLILSAFVFNTAIAAVIHKVDNKIDKSKLKQLEGGYFIPLLSETTVELCCLLANWGFK